MTIEERLEVLERELTVSRRRTRRLWISLWLAGVVCALILIFALNTGTAQAQGAGKVIRANQFIVEDESGKDRAWLIGFKDGSSLLLLDENGRGRAMLEVHKDGTGLRLSDENGKLRAALAINKGKRVLNVYDEGKAGPGLYLSDETGKGRVMLDMNKDGPELKLYDANGKRIWQAP